MIRKIFFILLLFLFQSSFAQQNSVNISDNYGRVSDIFNRSIFKFGTKVSRYQLLLNCGGYENPFFSSININLNGIEIGVFPLGQKSVDMIFTESFLIDKVLLNNNTFDFIEKDIIKKKKVLAKIFFGSQTGDPTIHLFTRSGNKELRNVNKIIPSGSFLYEGKSKKLDYRIAGGYYGYFLTGSWSDTIISKISNYYYQKQNKQFLGLLSLKYNFSEKEFLKFDTRIISFYGWDIPLFISTFSHYETYLSRLNLSYHNLNRNYFFGIVRDEGINNIHSGENLPPIKYSLSNYKIYGGIKNIFLLSTFSNLYFWGEIKESKNYRDFQNSFITDENKFYSKIKFEISKKLNDKTELKSFLIGEYFNEEVFIGGKIFLQFFINKNIFSSIGFSSVNNIPSLTELYGKYNFTSKLNEKLSVTGNSFLKNQKRRKIFCNLSFKTTNSKFQIFPYYEWIDNPIIQKTEKLYISSVSKNILRSANYINGKPFNYLGGAFKTDVSFSKNINFSFSGEYCNNKHFKYVSALKSYLSIRYKFDFNGELFFDINYKSAMDWSQFYITYKNEKKNSEFQDINSSITFDINYTQHIAKFLHLESLDFSLRMENIFNKELRFFPLGNKTKRTIIFSFIGRI